MQSVATRTSRKTANPMRILLIWVLVSGLLFGLADIARPVDDMFRAIRNKIRDHNASGQVAVIGIDYSLAPENKFPKALDECSAALDWIAAQADALNLDSGRILIGGDSAGANLSVATCLLRRARGLSLPAAMLLNYGAFAPERTPSYARFGDGSYSLEADEMDAFWAEYVDNAGQLGNPLVAPLHADLTGLPPAFLAIAECDILADCNHAFAEKLAAGGVAQRISGSLNIVSAPAQKAMNRNMPAMMPTQLWTSL